MAAVANTPITVSETPKSVSSTQTDESKTDFNDKLTKEIKRRFRKANWLMITNIYKILSQYGTPYGGAVRDYINRKNAADSYYAYCKEKGIDADTNYENKAVHPDTFYNRILVPKDVDVFITRKNLERFSKHISPICIMTKKSDCPLNYCFDSSDLLCKALTLEKWTLKTMSLGYSFVNKIIFGHHITSTSFVLPIDFIIINDEFLNHEEYINKGVLFPPFGNPDFDVNLLSFTIDKKYNLQINPLPYLEKLQIFPIELLPDSLHTRVSTTNELKIKIVEQITTNIINERARPIVPIKEQYVKVFGKTKVMETKGFRIFKMHHKYFILDFYNPILPSNITTLWKAKTSEYTVDDICAFCNKIFTDTNRPFRACNDCPRKVHLLCLRDFLIKAYDSNTASGKYPSCEDCGALNFTNDFYCENSIDIINFLINFVSYYVYKRSIYNYGECHNCKTDIKKCKCWLPIIPNFPSKQLEATHEAAPTQ